MIKSRLSDRNPQAFGFLITLLGVTFFFPDALVVLARQCIVGPLVQRVR